MIGKNNKKIGFIVDSSSNLTNGQFNDVVVLPLGVTTQNGNEIKTYKDGVDFNKNDLINVLSNDDVSIKTSQAAIPDMVKVTQEMCSKYDKVFVLPIHKNLSSNTNSWKLVKEDFPNLNIIMTCDIGYSFVWTIEEIKKFLLNNEPDETNVQKFVDQQIIPHRVGFLMVEDLIQLKKGGRVSGIKATLAKLFKIKPIILFDHNGLTNYGKAKDYNDLFNILDKHIVEKYNAQKIERAILFVPIDNDAAKTNFLTSYNNHFGSIPYDLMSFPTVVICHTGLKHVAIYVKLK